jgi:anaerobic selenocysteine-containing dehydrogenase
VDRFPYPFIEMNPEDMAELKVKPGDLVEVYNDNGSTQGRRLSDSDGKAKADVYVVRISHRRSGQRRLAWRERGHNPRL